jgi:hypothetical protein
MISTWKKITICLFCLCLSGCQKTAEPAETEQAETSEAVSVNSLSVGSADRLNGTTLIITIQIDDPQLTWNNADPADQEKMADVQTYLEIAGNYLEEAAEKYGSSADFITDFTSYPDLLYQMELTDEILPEGALFMNAMADTEIMAKISHEIDVDGLMQKYEADNIIFLTIVNTSDENTVNSCTTASSPSSPVPYEICHIFYMNDGEPVPPAVYAHELLHAFGAPDLYTPGQAGIDADDVAWFEKNLPDDIMLTTYEMGEDGTERSRYDAITNSFDPIIAYYAGLTDQDDTVDELGLEPAVHQ